ncbi:MAG: hypothetical protein JXB48_09010 [Candidatus Latescibacteria bacterium]|nr:hypothetical protein [Candidatus Latescibacterota bacterium]
MQSTEENMNSSEAPDQCQNSSKRPLNHSIYLDRKLSHGLMLNESTKHRFSDTPLNYLWNILNIFRFK